MTSSKANNIMFLRGSSIKSKLYMWLSPKDFIISTKVVKFDRLISGIPLLGISFLKISLVYNLKQVPEVTLPALPALCSAEDLEIGVIIRESR